MTLNEKIEAIRKKSESLLQQYQISGVRIRFDLRGRTAGQACWKREGGGLSHSPLKLSNLQLRYNVQFLHTDFDDMLNNTVDHEIAHLVDVTRRVKSDHSYIWARIMREMGADPSRCHDYDMSNIYHHVVKCDYMNHHVTERMYKKIKEGSGHRCNKCKSRLYLPLVITPFNHPTEVIQIAAQRPAVSASLARENVSYKQFCKNMIDEGQGKEAIKTAIINRYVTEGKEEAWAKTRANAIYAHMMKGK